MSWNLNVIDWEALSALGTFLAVIVSLMLARSNHKEKIKIYANYDHGALDSVYGLLVFIKIQNISHNDVYCT